MKRAPDRGSRACKVLLHRSPWLALLLCAGAQAEVKFEPEIAVGVANTDNVALANTNPQSETVYQLLPAFKLTQESPRVTSKASGRVEGYRYANLNDSQTYETVDGELRTALDPDNFFLVLGASRDQTIRDPRIAIPKTNLPISVNRVDRDDVRLGPEWKYPLGSAATVSGNYTRARIHYDQGDVPPTFLFVDDLVQDLASVSVDNYRRERGLTWAARYTSTKSDYDLFTPYEYREASVELGAWTGQHVRLFVSGGKESPWDMPFDPSLQDSFWEAGFASQVRGKLNVELAAGERSYGSSWRAALDFTREHGKVHLSYTEQPTTQGRDPYGQSAVVFTDGPDDLLGRLATPERFLSKAFSLDVDFDLGRTTILLQAFDEDRTERILLNGTPLGDEAQNRVTVSITRRFGARTELVFSASDADIDLVNVSDHLLWGSIAANYDVSARTKLSLTYGYSEETTGEVVGGPNYTARLLSLLLTRTFRTAR